MAETCPACRRATRTVLTRAHVRLAIDPEPSGRGNVVVEQLPSGDIRARILTGTDPEAPGDTVVAYTQHRATCPATAADTRPLCRSCDLPMGRPGNAGDAEVIRSEKWIEHAHCDTPAAAARARYALEQARVRHVQTELPEAS
jgi:hypothetical protein